MQYGKEKLEELAQIAETKGTYEAVALHLGIGATKLYEIRKKNTTLREVLIRAIKRYHSKNISLKDYVFTKNDLKEITEIVAESNIETAASKYGVSGQMFHQLRNNNPDLNKAIEKGQQQRENNTPYRKAMILFQSFDKSKLEEATKVAEQGGLEALEKKYGYSSHVLNKCRKQLPSLELAIKSGLRKRPTGMAIASEIKKATNTKKEGKPTKTYNKKGTTKKPPREIINKTMNGIADQADTALANFRKLVQERKKLDNIKRIRNGDFNNII